MHPVLLISVLACMLLGGCRRGMTVTYSSSRVTSASTLVAGTFITSAGSWESRQGDIGTELRVDLSGNQMSWHVDVMTYMPDGSSSGGGTGSSISIPAGGGGWFVYVESPERLWLFNGTDTLLLQNASRGRTSLITAISAGKLVPEVGEVPAELISRLPENMKKFFPAPATGPARPSI